MKTTFMKTVYYTDLNLRKHLIEYIVLIQALKERINFTLLTQYKKPFAFEY
jgi:hypothetical protein